MSARHANNFDAIRMLAALAVLYGHAFHISPTPDVPANPPGLGGDAIQAVAVMVFFALSGYLVTESWLRDPSVTRFLQRRLLRLMPGLIVVVLFCVFVVGLATTSFPPMLYLRNMDTRSFMTNMWMDVKYNLPGVFGSNRYPIAVNGSLWTLPCEALMYGILCAGFGVLRQETVLKFFAVLCVVAAACCDYGFQVFHLHNQPIVYLSQDLTKTASLAVYFWMGSSIRLFKLERFLNLQIAFLLILALVACNAPVVSRTVALPLLYVTIPYATLSFAFAPNPALAQAGKYGDISYGMYLYGFPIQQVVAKFLPLANPYVNFLVSAPIVMVLAAISWHFVEKRALSFKPKTPAAASSVAA